MRSCHAGMCRSTISTGVVGHAPPAVTCVTPICDVRHISSSGSGMGSGRGVHAPQRRASSTTRALVGPSPRKSSRMKGSVFAWSSHTPRPQNRQMPTAVRRQCQQSTLVSPHPLSMLPRLVDRRLQSTPLERVAHDLIESLAVQAECRTGVLAMTLAVRGTFRKRDLAEVRPGAHRSDDRPLADDVDPSGPDRVERVGPLPARRSCRRGSQLPSSRASRARRALRYRVSRTPACRGARPSSAAST